ncbi:hypothetical protein ACT7DF_13185 [Bacillus cereus]
MNFQIGQRISHNEHGEGVVISNVIEGFIQVFFSNGERRVPVDTISVILSRSEQIINNIDSVDEKRIKKCLANLSSL